MDSPAKMILERVWTPNFGVVERDLSEADCFNFGQNFKKVFSSINFMPLKPENNLILTDGG